jgi:diguanylate cyclase (GGDEF)-like protein/PAS domain S-box-containing protein
MAHTAADRVPAENSSGEQQGRRGRSPVPLIALLATLALTFLSVYDRASTLNRADASLRSQAEHDFTISVDNSVSRINSEVDRLTELVVGVRGFVDYEHESILDHVTEYLINSGAASRFPSLIGVLAADSGPEPVKEATGAVLRREGDEISSDALAFQPGWRELGRLAEATMTADLYDQAVLLGFEWEATPAAGVTFPISASFLDGPAVAWVSLVFEESTFLHRAIDEDTQVRFDLVATRTRSAPLTQSPPVRLDEDDGTLSTATSVDVFGSAFTIEATTAAGFVQGVSRIRLYVLTLLGAAFALAVFIVLRIAFGARAQALQQVQDSAAERAAIDSRFRASFELSPIGMAELDRSGTIVALNEAMARQVGLDRAATLGQPLSALVHESDRETHMERISSLLEGVPGSAQGEHRFRHANNREIWVTESVSAIDSPSGRSLLVQSQDITSQRQAAWDLTQQALHDSLTELPNRALFLNRLKHALDRSRRSDEQLAVMFLDVDRFKVINDSLGHDVGDRFLVQMSKRIANAVRSGDTVARFGGDEFVVLCESVAGESEAIAVAQRIERSFAEPFELGEAPTFASVSIGITLSGHDGDTADTMLRDADAAMYRAKEGGRARTEVFDHSMRTSVIARMEIESQLRSALDNGEISMHYQAIVDPLSHLPAGFEALVRWNHPEKGLLGPSAFLGVAEEAGLIHLIDSFALRESCHQLAGWLDAYPAARDLYVACNWSAGHLGWLLQQVTQVLDETGIAPRHLVIEVTEGFLLEDTDASIAAIAQLKAMGVRIAIDDFGTGYSSLSYLTQFDVDFLKIDQSFVDKLPDDAASIAVIGAIADMASRLGIALVAEGVETDEQIDMLSKLGGPRMQGYRFAKPRPAEDIGLQLSGMSTATGTPARIPVLN